MEILRAQYWIILFFVSLLSGCATVASNPPETTYTPPAKGIYHKVRKGQSLWRISKVYDVPVNEIIDSNHIPDIASLEENQLIFIPNATTIKDVSTDDNFDSKDFSWPIRGKVVNYFHERKRRTMNQGIDIKAQRGEIVRPARPGAVVFADYLSGYGETVIVDHGDGYYSIYSQLAKLLVKLGDGVSRATPLASLSNENLHFQIRKRGLEDNPLHYLP